MILGQNDVSIATWNKNLLNFSDDGERFSGAYGPKFVEQLSYVIHTLTKDPDSRQAIINIWRERPGPSKDIPCTLSFQFFIRDHMVEMITTMRSNDVFLGLPYDLFNFTMIQNLVANMLEFSTGVQYGLGQYVHQVGSLHVYEKHYEAVRKILNERSPKDSNLEWRNVQSARFGGYNLIGLRREFNDMAVHGERFEEAVTAELDKRFDQYGGVWGNLLKVLASKWHPALVECLREPYRTLLS
jgi:thymidylate synthase